MTWAISRVKSLAGVAFWEEFGESILVQADTDTPNRKMMKDDIERWKELEFELDDHGVDLSRFHFND